MTSYDDHVISMEYLTDSESVCLALAGGNILLCNIITGEIGCVGEIEVGVVGMGWSPDQDLVVVVTGSDKVVLMTKDFDPLAEKSVHQKDFGEGTSIAVSGSRRTCSLSLSLPPLSLRPSLPPL
jgi:elongator complex protein 1